MKKLFCQNRFEFKAVVFMAIAATFAGPHAARANEVVREGTATIDETREGTKVEMSDAEVAELKQWIQNAKYALEQLRENYRLLSLNEKLSLTREEFKRVVDESGAKGNELYVRYILNRALLVTDALGANPGSQEKESLLGLYVESIDLALKHYVDDAAYLEAIGKGVAPSKDLKHIAVFGLEYADKLLAYSQTFLDPRIEYKLTRTALGLLGNDLNSSRNLDRALFTQEIIKIQQLLKVFPRDARPDIREVMKDIRKLKFEYRETLRPRLADKIATSLQIRVAPPFGGNNRAAPAPVAQPAHPRSGGGGGGVFSGRSYDACYKTLSRDSGGSAASDKCASVAKWFNFDGNADFNLCFSNQYQSLNAMDALNKCVDYVGVKKWKFNNENYKTCYASLSRDSGGSAASDKCIDVSRWFNFNNNNDYNVCFAHHYQSLNAMDSLNRCVKALSDR